MDLLKYKIVVFDLDGTIYYGDKIIDGANDVIQYFRNNGIRVYFVSNNSVKKRNQIFNKLVNMGIDCIVNEVINSGLVSSFIIKKLDLKNVYVFGSENLKMELKENRVDVTDDVEKANNLIIGYNPDFNYIELTKAVRVALKSNKIIACNEDRVFPGNNGELYPGCGAMVAPVTFCANREVDYFVGKPNPLMLKMIASENNVKMDDILVIGDNYETDIKMAIDSKCASIYIGKEIYDNTACVKTIKSILEL